MRAASLFFKSVILLHVTSNLPWLFPGLSGPILGFSLASPWPLLGLSISLWAFLYFFTLLGLPPLSPLGIRIQKPLSLPPPATCRPEPSPSREPLNRRTAQSLPAPSLPLLSSEPLPFPGPVALRKPFARPSRPHPPCLFPCPHLNPFFPGLPPQTAVKCILCAASFALHLLRCILCVSSCTMQPLRCMLPIVNHEMHLTFQTNEGDRMHEASTT